MFGCVELLSKCSNNSTDLFICDQLIILKCGGDFITSLHLCSTLHLLFHLGQSIFGLYKIDWTGSAVARWSVLWSCNHKAAVLSPAWVWKGFSFYKFTRCGVPWKGSSQKKNNNKIEWTLPLFYLMWSNLHFNLIHMSLSFYVVSWCLVCPSQLFILVGKFNKHLLFFLKEAQVTSLYSKILKLIRFKMAKTANWP